MEGVYYGDSIREVIVYISYIGILSESIQPNTVEFYQKAAFVDPHFYAKPTFENKTVFALDIGKYGLSELQHE